MHLEFIIRQIFYSSEIEDHFLSSSTLEKISDVSKAFLSQYLVSNKGSQKLACLFSLSNNERIYYLVFGAGHRLSYSCTCIPKSATSTPSIS